MKRILTVLLIISCSLSNMKAQQAASGVPQEATGKKPDTVKPADSVRITRNLIKFNITSALIKNYSLQYERVLSRGVSLAVSFRYMPESGIPYTDYIFRQFDITDPDTKNVIENSLIGNIAVTPEIRFYTGKKRYGNGFYFSLFYRYGHYTLSNALIPYDTDGGEQVTLNTSGNISSHSGGFMLGAQWTLGKHICLDWWILGPHFGISSGDMLSLSSGPLSEVDQSDIADELNSIDIPMFKQTVNVTSDKVSMVFDGPWAGVRAGISLGVRF